MSDLFTKQTVGQLDNNVGPAPMNTFHTAGDLNGNGLPDLVLCGRDGLLAWFENPGRPSPWRRHTIAEVSCQECGGLAADLTGNGLADVLNGGDWRSDAVFWWENTGAFDQPWRQRLVARTGAPQFHDTLLGDIADGTPGLIFTNQQGPDGTHLYWLPLPADPRVEPWPHLTLIAGPLAEPNPARPDRNGGRQPAEGLAIGDLDGDGRDELVCGTQWFKWNGRGWDGHRFADGYITTKCAIADVDGDGRNEILLAEGDPLIYGRPEGGRLAVFRPGADLTAPWREQVLLSGLRDGHSLAVGDVLGSGRLDIFVGEIGQAAADRGYAGALPRLLLLANQGGGGFAQHLIDQGTGTHEALLLDTRGNGRLDILGKPLHGPERWSAHVWYRND